MTELLATADQTLFVSPAELQSVVFGKTDDSGKVEVRVDFVGGNYLQLKVPYDTAHEMKFTLRALSTGK